MEETEMKALVRKELVAAGAPPHLIDAMVDVGFHAAQKACESLLTAVLAVQGQAEVIQATMIAVGVLRSRLDAMENTVRETLTSAGMPFTTMSTAPADA
jgi:hypothetical protein